MLSFSLAAQIGCSLQEEFRNRLVGGEAAVW